MRVRDIMTSPVYTVEQSTPVEKAAEFMTGNAVTALPVVDSAGNLVGMVSESDLLWHRVPADPTAHARRLPDTALTDPSVRLSRTRLFPRVSRGYGPGAARYGLMMDGSGSGRRRSSFRNLGPNIRAFWLRRASARCHRASTSWRKRFMAR